MAWLPTLDEMETRVYAVLRDSERAFVTETQVDQWLNEAYMDICARLRIPQGTTTSTTSASGTITLPSDFIEPISVSFTDSILQWSAPNVMETWVIPDITPAGVVLGRIFNGVIETWPAQESETYTLRYVKHPTVMTTGSDQPSSLPAEMAPRLINYARAFAKYQEGEFNEGDRFMALYVEGLPGAPRGLGRVSPGQVTFTPTPGVFDVEEWSE